MIAKKPRYSEQMERKVLCFVAPGKAQNDKCGVKSGNNYNYKVSPAKAVNEEGKLRRTKIRGCLRVPVTEIQRYEKELRKQRPNHETF